MSTPDLEYVSCPTSNCGGQWLPVQKVNQLRASHETFYCSSGHRQWFDGQSQLEKLEARVKLLIADIEALSLCPLCQEPFRFDRSWHMHHNHGAYMKKTKSHVPKARKAA